MIQKHNNESPCPILGTINIGADIDAIFAEFGIGAGTEKHTVALVASEWRATARVNY